MSTRRYARLQVDADAIPDDDKPPQSGHTFNIWFLKWAGGDSNSRNLVKSKFRVNIKKDAGLTRGVDGRSPICLFFARGCCYKGRKCPYLHRLPDTKDLKIPTQDCFGRDKTADYRDDMGGVGSLQRSNRTLYVTGAHVNDSVQEEIGRQFSEFGGIDKIRVLHAKNCAFVTYRSESEAQFAKEAMDGQSLDGNDILTVKWANDDPDPQAQQSAKRDMEQMAMDTVRQLLGDTGDFKKHKGNSREVSAFQKAEKERNVKADVGSHGEASVSAPGDVAITQPGILDGSRLSALKKLQRRPETGSRVAPLEESGNGESKVEKSAEPASSAFLAGYSSDEESE